MALRNRVTPIGEIVADPARGLVYGNRGCLHDDEGRIRRVYAVRRWIACRLEFKGRQRGPLLQPGRFTELFFLDEATAFAAGHRPCALCRRADYDRYRAAWADATGSAASAKDMNRVLHGERIVRGTHRRRLHAARAADLPDGVFVELDGTPHVLTGDAAVAWTHQGYAVPRTRPTSGSVTVITPPASVAALRAGYVAQIDPGSARRNAEVAADRTP
jgi:hypothetical protein